MKSMVGIIVILFAFVVILTGAAHMIMGTSFAATKLGGTLDVAIPDGSELVNASWKNNSLWILLKDKSTSKMTLKEVSSWGVLSGEVKFLQESSRQEQVSVLPAESSSTTATFTLTIPGATGTSK